MSWLRLVPRCSRLNLHKQVLNVSRNSSRYVGARAVAPPEQNAAPTTSEISDYPQVPFRAAIDYKYIVENVDKLKVNAANRKSNADPEKVAELYALYRQLHLETDALRMKRNENAKAMKGKMVQEQRQELIQAGQALKEELADYEDRLRDLENALQFEAQILPNLTHPNAAIGGEENAILLKEVGEKISPGFEVKNHVELMEALDLIDFEAAADVTGSKFYYLRNAAAMLELALINYTMQKVASRGFTPIMTPDLVRDSVLEKCGFQPRADNTQTYSIENSDLCLTGTAEVPLGGIYMDKVIEEKQLPIRMAAFGHCFRTEAGAAGMAGKGLYRVHQFSKVEMFVLCTPDQAEALLDELMQIEVELFTELGLHFKVIDMPSGDLGAPAYRKVDIEAWMPGLQRYGEISSASNCTDYQARRLNSRYRVAAKPKDSDAQADASGPPKKKQKKAKGSPTAFCYTLNATACAVPRLMVSIIENNQQEDGSITIPEVLQPYMGGQKVIEAVKIDS